MEYPSSYSCHISFANFSAPILNLQQPYPTLFANGNGKRTDRSQKQNTEEGKKKGEEKGKKERNEFYPGHDETAKTNDPTAPISATGQSIATRTMA